MVNTDGSYLLMILGTLIVVVDILLGKEESVVPLMVGIFVILGGFFGIVTGSSLDAFIVVIFLTTVFFLLGKKILEAKINKRNKA